MKRNRLTPSLAIFWMLFIFQFHNKLNSSLTYYAIFASSPSSLIGTFMASGVGFWPFAQVIHQEVVTDVGIQHGRVIHANGGVSVTVLQTRNALTPVRGIANEKWFALFALRALQFRKEAEM